MNNFETRAVLLRRQLSLKEDLKCTLVIVVKYLVLAAENIITYAKFCTIITVNSAGRGRRHKGSLHSTANDVPA